MNIVRSIKWLETGATVLVVAALLTSCGRKQQNIDPTAFAAGWLATETEHMTLFEPPDSPRVSLQMRFAENSEEVLTRLMELLELDLPEKIEIYRFVTNQDCLDATGHSAGYVDGYRIYTRIGAPMGGALALAAFTSVDPEAASFELIRDGFREAFDHLYDNLHQETSRLRAEGRWLPLQELITPGEIADREAYDAQSASFVGYLIQRHGVEKFKMLWRSVLELGPSLEKIYGGSVRQIEEDWIVHLEREAKKA